MRPEVRRALNLAARVVEEEAILFDEEAAEIMPEEGGAFDTREARKRFEQTRGRAKSLRNLATQIRNLKP